MDPNYVLTCGVVWERTADPEAGSELVEALGSPDPRLRLLAQLLLVENGSDSMDLLEGAVAKGTVSPEAAGPCMAEILRNEKAGQPGEKTIRRSWIDVSVC